MKIPKRAPPVTEEYREMIRKLHEYPANTLCPKCGSETETDDEAHYQCTNLGCINAWFPFTYEEKVQGGKE